MFNRILAIAVVLAGMVVPTQAAIIARYEFTSGTPLADSSGNGYGLTQAGTVTYGSATINSVPLRTATATNGASSSSNALSRTAGYGATTLDSLSVSLWAFYTSTQINDDIATVSSGAAGWQLQNTSSNTQYAVFTTGGSAPSAAGLTTSAWHHFVVTQGGGVTALYVDGTLRSSQPTTLSGSLAEFYLFRGDASFASGDLRGWNGSIADVQIYNEALSLSQVSTMFANPGTVAIPEPGMFGISIAAVTSAILFSRRKATR